MLTLLESSAYHTEYKILFQANNMSADLWERLVLMGKHILLSVTNFSHKTLTIGIQNIVIIFESLQLWSTMQKKKITFLFYNIMNNTNKRFQALL